MKFSERRPALTMPTIEKPPQISLSRKTQQGFSLVELLMVVAVIGVIAAIAAGNFLTSKQAANSASAVNSLRIIHSSQTAYRMAHDVYAADLATLGSENFLSDPSLRSGNKSRYGFTINLGADPAMEYESLATPEDTAARHYLVDRSGIIRWRAGASATAASPPLD